MKLPGRNIYKHRHSFCCCTTQIIPYGEVITLLLSKSDIQWGKHINKIRGERSSHRERQILYDITYMCNFLKNDTNELIYKNRNRLTDIGNKFMVTKVEGEEG